MLRHPLAPRDAPTPGAVTGPEGGTYPVGDDGGVECPADVADALRTAWADRYDSYEPTPAPDATADDTSVGDDADDDTTDESGACEEVKQDGEVCGRERPCPYHD